MARARSAARGMRTMSHRVALCSGQPDVIEPTLQRVTRRHFDAMREDGFIGGEDGNRVVALHGLLRAVVRASALPRFGRRRRSKIVMDAIRAG